jgi:NCAIR mutase (PurE)-related protein
MGQTLAEILGDLTAGRLTEAQAEAAVRARSVEPLGFATLDHQRAQRCGVGEVIYAQGKTAEQVVRIARALAERSGHALITRATAEQTGAIESAFVKVMRGSRGQTLLVGEAPAAGGTAIPIVTAGTSDEAVAEEAELTCVAMGQRTTRVNDVGVAGLARLIERVGEMKGAGVIVCIAGMEGALPSVVGGLVDVPVIAVPTSVGYGAAFDGIAALLGMMTSCAAGVTVVNINNGFGAAYAATLIQRQIDAARSGAR